MMNAARLIYIGFVLVQFIPQAQAVESSKIAPPEDKYGITEEEKAACSNDAILFCSGTYPDEDKLLLCMKQNHANLSIGCRQVFDHGVHRRHL